MENEKRLIDVNAIPESATAISTDGRLFVAWSAIVDAPTVEAVPVVHGRWNADDWHGLRMRGFMACSACNVMIPTPDDNRYCLHRLNYCPNCGAKMDGGVKE